MSLTVAALLAALERLVPARLAAPWDNSGLQVGDPRAEVSRVLVALDATPDTIGEATTRGCQALVAHHPLILEPIKRIGLHEPLGRAIGDAVRHGVAIVAAHTNYDSVPWGVSQVLAERLGLEDTVPLQPLNDSGEGLGRVGTLPRPLSLAELAALARQRLGTTGLRYVEGPGRPIRRVAVCGGSGMSLAEAALAAGAEAFVTGDVRYHQARAYEGRLAVIDCGHFAGETPALEPLAAAIRRELPGLAEVTVCQREQDPFKSD
ncbi:MAG: Nif3-like dinuclear metal center hexameric protein [Pseudomonadota bacterium]